MNHVFLDIVSYSFFEASLSESFAPSWSYKTLLLHSAKKCLKKSVGRNCLSYDEILTLITEVEAVHNSRPLTYVSSEDVEEPLTPSHLLIGYRILTLPDPSTPEDPDYSLAE